MQQRLMLRRRPRRSRLRGHRLHTLALARQDQPGAIVAHWANPVGVPEHTRKPRHIRRKSCFGLLFVLPIHVSTSRANPESSQILDSQSRSVRPSDSVRLSEASPPFTAYENRTVLVGTLRFAHPTGAIVNSRR